MARGAQKEQSQKKNLKRKQELAKKKQKADKKGASTQISIKCSVCMTEINNLGTSVFKLEQHTEAKHGKKTVQECFPEYDRLKADGEAKAAKLKAKEDKARAKEDAKVIKKKKKTKGDDLADLEAAIAGM